MNIYHLSPSNLNNTFLHPRTPDNFFTKNGFEDARTKRVCFSTEIDGCLLGMSMNLTGKILYVHQPVSDVRIIRPTVKQVPDSKITKEVWVKDKVKIKCIGIIQVIKDKGTDGIPFKYGNNVAELYEWDWKWIKKFSEVEQIYNDLIGGVLNG